MEVCCAALVAEVDEGGKRPPRSRPEPSLPSSWVAVDVGRAVEEALLEGVSVALSDDWEDVEL